MHPPVLFSVVNKLTNPPAPVMRNSDLCESFLHFFQNKINCIYNLFPTMNSPIHSHDIPSDFAPGTFTDSDPPTPVYISELLKKSNPSLCHLDPAPTALLKYSAHYFVAYFTSHFSTFCTGAVPLELKTAAKETRP